MATIKFDGLKEYEAKLSMLSKNLRPICGRVTYEGAKVVADEVRKEMEKLPEETGVTKRGLQKGFGISNIRDDNGFYNVKLGFDGYNERGVANQLMARILESGTSKTKKHPFVRPAVNRSRQKCLQEMQETLDEEIEKTMK